MKQRKLLPAPYLKSQDQVVMRREIDACLKLITAEIEKNPKKAAQIFEVWLGEKSLKNQKRKAA